MKKPVFSYSNSLFTLSWLLTVPILIDISTACTLFSFWIVWLLYALVLIISIIRLWHGFAQKCYKFCFSLFGQLALGAIILVFFQLSFNNVIHTPFSKARTPDIVDIANPVLVADSAKNKNEDKKMEINSIKHSDSSRGDSSKTSHKESHSDKSESKDK